jgi:cyanosortase A-associated protein
MVILKTRLPFLIFTFGVILCVTGRVMLLEKSRNPFIFPEALFLPQWQLKASNNLAKPIKHSELINQKHYRYVKHDLPLDIEMRYVNYFDVNKLIDKYTNISANPIVRQQKGIGYYGLLFDKQRAYLSACINPQGNSTFSYQQFKENRRLYDQREKRFLPWLLGEEIENNRCLWAHLSVPLNNSPDTAYKTLENASKSILTSLVSTMPRY